MVENTRLVDLAAVNAETTRILSELKVSVDSIAKRFDEWTLLFTQLIKEKEIEYSPEGNSSVSPLPYFSDIQETAEEISCNATEAAKAIAKTISENLAKDSESANEENDLVAKNNDDKKGDICCFDKTGTLTSDKMEFSGVGGLKDNETETSEVPDWALELLASCRTWVFVDNKLHTVQRQHLSFEPQLIAGKSHDFGPLGCPEQPSSPGKMTGIAYGRQKHEAELKYPHRLRRLNIFPASKLEDLQPIDHLIVEEYMLDVLLYLNGCRKECAASMVGLPVPFRYEYLMAETISSQILLLSQPPFKPIYYTLVIMDLCKVLPGAFPAVVAGAVRALFDRIADLDMECRTRLILWFSHHLSNFQCIWPWEEWAYVLELPKWAPQRVFFQEVLEREVCLSYWEKIKQSIKSAPGLEELLPPKGTPNFIYSTEDGDQTEHGLSSELSKMVKEQLSSREIITWIDENALPTHGFEITLRVVVQTLLNIGSKSFTHLITVLERYGQIISRICLDQDKQVMLIAEISSSWKNNAQMTAIAIDRMMGYRLISNLTIGENDVPTVDVIISDCGELPEGALEDTEFAMRNVVREGQFYQVLLYGLDAIRKACASLETNYQPSVIFAIVQKRHHTRLEFRRQVNQLIIKCNGMKVDQNLVWDAGGKEFASNGATCCHPKQTGKMGIQSRNNTHRTHSLEDKTVFEREALL